MHFNEVFTAFHRGSSAPRHVCGPLFSPWSLRLMASRLIRRASSLELRILQQSGH